MTPSSLLKSFVESGSKAPSGHNTQPWRFVLQEDEIQIHPDFRRALPVVDNDNHALYISLGCAAENIILAAKNKSYQSSLSIAKNENGVDFIRIKFTPDTLMQRDDLFDFIEKRQVVRGAYSADKVPSEDLKQLLDAFNFPGISLQTFISPAEKKELEPFIIEGSDRQFQNPDFVNELVSWIRFSKKEVEKTRDGIWHASMGMPSSGRFLGEIILKKLVSAKSEAKKWKKIIEASAEIVLFVVDENQVSSWVTLGRALQRLGLTATKLNLQHAHLNMPCEEISVRKKMATHLGLVDKHPLLLLRFGYADSMPYSYRRLVDEMISENKKEDQLRETRLSS